MNKIVIASDSYKECLTSKEVGKNIKAGFEKVFPNCEYKIIELADGGEGTLDAIESSIDVQKIKMISKNSLNEDVESYYLIDKINKTAFIELANTVGLEKIKDSQKDCKEMSTYGCGLQILDAIQKGYQNIFLAIGSSSSNDFGLGICQALGYEFLDKNKNKINPIGKNLSKIKKINDKNILPEIKKIKIKIASDVDNPLCGKSGAAFVYAQQKGATQKEIQMLDKGLSDISSLVKKKYKIDVLNIPGSGAAGGCGGGLIAILNAELVNGFEVISEFIKLEEILKDADLVITGEGKIDSQTINGKVPIGVCKVAKKYNIKTICIAGTLGKDYEKCFDHGIDAIFSPIDAPGDIKEIIQKTPKAIENLSYSIAKLLK